MKKQIVVVAALSVVLTGCTSGGVTNNPDSGTNADRTTSTPKPKATKAQPKLGQAYEWKDGLTIKTEPAKDFEPSQYASGGEKSPDHVLLVMTVVNKTGKVFDPSLISVNVQSGNEEADPIFDDTTLSQFPSTKLLDGREAKFTLGYGVKDRDDLVVDVQPDSGLDYDDAIFTN